MCHRLSSLLASCLCTVGLFQIAIGQMTTCSFPSFLTGPSQWEARISYERRVIGTVWQFTPTVATSTDASSPAEAVTMSYYCINSTVLPLGRTLFVRVTSTPLIINGRQQSVASSNQQTFVGYRCLRFVKRSSYVIQVFKSTSDTQSSDPEWCNNGPPIILDDYPLVQSRPEGASTGVQCGIIGGYKFTLQPSTSNRETDRLCANTPLLPVMESDCGHAGEGISFDFRQLNCMGKLSLPVVTNVQCLAAWNDSESGYSFTILTNADKTWPKLWMLRTPSIPQAFGSSFVGHISTEVSTNVNAKMTPRSAADHAYTINMTATSYRSLCENEANGCSPSLCNANNFGGMLSETFCQKTCSTCLADSGDTWNCSFSNDVIGSWLEVSDEPSRLIRTIVVDGQTLSFSDVASRSVCVDFTHYSSASVGQPQRFPTVTLYPSTGCRPRYACLQLVRRSEGVMTYEIGQTVQWPYNKLNAIGEQQQLTAAILCDDSMFQTVNPAILIRKSLPLTTVQCQLPSPPGWLQLSGEHADGETVQAVISQCSASNAIDVFKYTTLSSPSASAMNELKDDNHRCIGVFFDAPTGDQYIATVASGSYYCWVFQRRPWNSNTRLYVTRASDCNQATGNGVQQGGFTGFIAAFDVVLPTEQVAAPGLTLSLYSALSNDCTELNASSAVTPQVSSATTKRTTPTTRLSSTTITTTRKQRGEVGKQISDKENNAAALLTSYVQIISAFAIFYVCCYNVNL